jgi:hypothetical protein
VFRRKPDSRPTIGRIVRTAALHACLALVVNQQMQRQYLCGAAMLRCGGRMQRIGLSPSAP